MTLRLGPSESEAPCALLLFVTWTSWTVRPGVSIFVFKKQFLVAITRLGGGVPDVVMISYVAFK